VKEFFRRTRKSFNSTESPEAPQIPDDLWIKCSVCRELIYKKQLNDNMKVCPKCGHHMRLGAREWLGLLDVGSFSETDANLLPLDPLGFSTPDESYADKLKKSQQRTGMADAVIAGVGSVNGIWLTVAVGDFSFMGSSMGSVYGEKMARAAERAADLGVPLLTINTSGGARQQEGVIALMQMAKVTMALTRLAEASQAHIALLVDPCYGGVTASYPSVADVIIAEPGANIGFAGKRLIEQIMRQKLPAGFQTAEFMLEHGMIDMVVSRSDLRDVLDRLLRHYTRQANAAGKADQTNHRVTAYTNGKI
jgi:acetyl-CoA carboxylase carboxyl transferase subunit beta